MSALIGLAGFGLGLAVGWVVFRVGNKNGKNEAQQLVKNAVRHSASKGQHKMVLVVRTELKMSSGKIAAQCGHATLGAYQRAMKKNAADVKSWSKTGQAKIALKCPTLAEMHALAERASRAGLNTYIVADAGLTQIEEGSETVLAIGPAPKSEIDAITSHLKLL